ncbi:MAG: M23 family metallopeptidase [candidate division Zixibacteria bacterium]|nr:M23 family metallopeptidase [candidate division Zixibacteria bacterium]MDH3937743.1 M23 family metallopeptidase [candidate division Zixibacteria bacterium]MDH4033083.1 M23 family metallopeptidase [candidate division Zixibacteria bacterium]
MFRKKITLIMIPDASGIFKQVKVPVASLYIAGGALLVLLVAGLFFTSQYFNDQVAQKELARLQNENTELASQFEQMRWSLSEVEARYGDLVEKEIVLRSAFDLPEIDIQERQLGVGGPKAVTTALSTTQQTAQQAEVDLDYLLRLSRFELEKYDEVHAALDDLQDRLKHTPSIWPCKGWYSRGYGQKYDPFTGYKRMHWGIDLANPRGTQIVATADGKVIKVGNQGGMGKTVVIDHGYGFKTLYGHLSKSNVKRGQRVKRGEVIALMGSTGYSTGPHLHYEVSRNGKRLNPRKYILNEK